KDISDTASVHSRHHVLRKQQSTSSGFAESIGFSKRLNQSETKFGTLTSSHLFTNKALPTVPTSVPSPPLPVVPHQLTDPAQSPTITHPADPHTAATMAPGPTTTAHGGPTVAMAFAPDTSVDSSPGGLGAGVQNGKPNNSSIESQKRNSRYYSPMDEFFSVASAEDRQTTGDHESIEPLSAAEVLDAGREQGPDSKAGCTPEASPALAESSLKYDSAAAVVAVDMMHGSDDDSDIVPLSQSRVLVEAGARNELSARLASNAASLGTAAAAPSAEPNNDGGAGADDTSELQAATIQNDVAVAEATADATELPPEAQASTVLAQASGDELVGDSAEVADGQAAGSEGQDNTQLARAMGHYLYVLEEYYCRYYSSQERKDAGELEAEPAKPAVLQGFDIPALVDHAEWLGKREIFNALTLRYYITNFDFGGQRIDECLRRLCSHIYLRGESQVIDRLLVALAQRYVECNSDTRLLTADVAHAVTYSTLLLNTDLHIADIRAMDRMTRSRFVRNTIDTITQFQSAASAPAAKADSTSHADEPAVASPPPQLPELDLSKQSIDSAHGRAATLVDAPLTAPMDGRHVGDTAEGDAPLRSAEPSTLRSLVGSMASLNIAPAGSAASRSSRDVVRLMGGRGKRFSFFESSSSSNASGLAPVSVSASATPVLSSTAPGAQTPTM
ncbi:hypothetical protein H4S01_005693, partial [Coemansia sp. RSA 2610]